MLVNCVPWLSGALLRDGLVCWSLVLDLKAVRLSEGDKLHLKWDNGFCVDLEHLSRTFTAYSGVVRTTACGVIVAQLDPAQATSGLPPVTPPLTCLGCLDAMGLYPFPDFAAWNATASHRLALGLCL